MTSRRYVSCVSVMVWFRNDSYCIIKSNVDYLSEGVSK